MVVGTAEIQIHIPQSRSLKDKRQVLRSLKERVRSRFNVSIAEVDHQDLWQRAALGVATVATDAVFAQQVLSEVLRMVEAEGRLAVLDVQVEMR